MVKNKKAELTTQQIVILIVVLISFVVLLVFLFLLNPAQTDAKQICHNSIVLQDKVKGAFSSVDCKTNTLNVDAITKDEVMKLLANEMSNCWWMFGEGKIDYTSGRVYPSKSCVVCSTVKFDDKTQKSISLISYQDFYDYMRTTQKTNSQSYLQYLYSANALSYFQQFYVLNYLSNKIDTSKEYFVLTGRSKGIVWTLFGITGNNPIPVTILENTKQNYDAVGCDEFLTKAQ